MKSSEAMILAVMNAILANAQRSLKNVMRCIFSDVAIGAPYENDGEGVVYIYRGSLDGLVKTPMQVLS